MNFSQIYQEAVSKVQLFYLFINQRIIVNNFL